MNSLAFVSPFPPSTVGTVTQIGGHVSYQHIHPSGIQQWLRPMQPRDPDEGHRASTPLELFFDLVFVVAVAQAANSLHHALIEGGSVGAPVGKYILVFFGIWWAWMNFSWFASAYDTEDIAYRLTVFVQMTGALIYAAGIPRAFDELDFSVAVIGYVVMRLAQVSHWLRASAGAEPAGRHAPRRYAIGIIVCQLGWIALLVLPGGWEVAGFIFLGACRVARSRLGGAGRHDVLARQPHHRALRVVHDHRAG